MVTMGANDPRTALGDRVPRSLQHWLTRLAMRHRCTRADVLGRYLSAGRATDEAGSDPLRILELSSRLQAAGVDPERLLAARCETVTE
ncbi:MAG: hypothetical protein KF861_10040 [Planctomycetaceae bacterium]|nr:hypothetical protein [Planctomycetaceae bacterium]